jgi:hypothetical protein
VKPLVLTILLLAGTLTPDDVAAIAKLADCENAPCLKDAYYTLHAPNRGAAFFFRARMLQLYPHSSGEEIALLETLPATIAESDALLSFAAAEIGGRDERELRDEVVADILEIYERAADRHPDYAQRLAIARPLIADAQRRVQQRATARPAAGGASPATAHRDR